MTDAVYVLVLTKSSISDHPVCLFRPFIVVNSEKETAKLLLAQYPTSTLVFGSKRTLMNRQYDIIEEDFDDPLIPIGDGLLTSGYVAKVSAMATECESLEELERRIVKECPESESAMFIEQTYKDIQENGLKQISAVNFQVGGRQ